MEATRLGHGSGLIGEVSFLAALGIITLYTSVTHHWACSKGIHGSETSDEACESSIVCSGILLGTGAESLWLCLLPGL